VWRRSLALTVFILELAEKFPFVSTYLRERGMEVLTVTDSGLPEGTAGVLILNTSLSSERQDQIIARLQAQEEQLEIIELLTATESSGYPGAITVREPFTIEQLTELISSL
jgi:hypothetical protein